MSSICFRYRWKYAYKIERFNQAGTFDPKNAVSFDSLGIRTYIFVFRTSVNFTFCVSNKNSRYVQRPFCRVFYTSNSFSNYYYDHVFFVLFLRFCTRHTAITFIHCVEKKYEHIYVCTYDIRLKWTLLGA